MEPTMNMRVVLAIPGSNSPAARGVIHRLRRTASFRWAAVLALLCTIGLYAAESSHQHKTEVGELRCPVCQVLAHGALDLFVPGIDSAFRFRTPYLVSISHVRTFFREQSIVVHPPSRAPPSGPVV